MGLSTYLPYETHVFETKLSTLEVLNRVQDSIEPVKGFRLALTRKSFEKPYTGRISGLKFTMQRNISYRNSFNPSITGSIETYSGFTQVRIKMRLVPVVMAFMAFWLAVVGLVCIVIVIAGLREFNDKGMHSFAPQILIPFGMFVAGYLMMMLAFRSESRNSVKFLANLLETNETELTRHIPNK